MAKKDAIPMATTNPKKERGDKRKNARTAAQATLQALDGQEVTAVNRDDILTAVLQLLGYADDAGKIIST